MEFKNSLKDVHKAMEPRVKNKASNRLFGTHYMAFDDVSFVSCLLTQLPELVLDSTMVSRTY